MKPIRYMGDGPGEGVGNVEWRLDTSAPSGYVPCKGQSLNIKDYPALEAAGVIQKASGNFDGYFNAAFNDAWASTAYTKASFAPGRMAMGDGTVILPYFDNSTNNLIVQFMSLDGGGTFGSTGGANKLPVPVRSIGTTSNMFGASFANGKFFVTTNLGVHVWEVSSSEWLFSRSGRPTCTLTDYVSSYNPERIVYGNGIYVGHQDGVGTKTSTGSFATADWTSRTVASTSGTFRDLYFDGSKFILLFSGSIHTSTDGVTWSVQTMTGLSGSYAYLAWDNLGGYMILSNSQLYYSTNFSSWTAATVPTSFNSNPPAVLLSTGSGILAMIPNLAPVTFSLTSLLAITADLGTNWTDIATSADMTSTPFNVGATYVVSDGASAIITHSYNVSASHYYSWFSLGSKLPPLRPRYKEANTYYPYIKTA